VRATKTVDQLRKEVFSQTEPTEESK
jgi:hypothetical protein